MLDILHSRHPRKLQSAERSYSLNLQLHVSLFRITP